MKGPGMEIPPLRERRADIPLLVEHYLKERTGGEAEEGANPVSPLAMRILQSHSWPGNVRELFSVLASARIQAQTGARIEAQHLPRDLREERQGSTDGAAEGEDGGGRYVPPGSPGRERETILAALEEADGVRSRAARTLGMGRTTLWRKMKEYGIQVEE